MTYTVAELTGHRLDAAVAKANGFGPNMVGHVANGEQRWSPSTKWENGGAIIERGRIMLTSYANGDWEAFAIAPDRIVERLGKGGTRGPTPLIAAMRAFVVANLGEEIELP